MTEPDAITLLHNHTHATGYLSAPNVNALGHESDYLLITRAGRVYEFEVKLTANDFKADFKGKPGSKKWARQQVMQARFEGRTIGGWDLTWGAHGWTPNLELTPDQYQCKHKDWITYGQLLPAPSCPHRFYYCYPGDLHEALEPLVPAWAGIVLLDRWARTIKQAKNLHRESLTDVREKLLVSTNQRYWLERQSRREAERERARVEELARLAALNVLQERTT